MSREERGQISGDQTINEKYTLWGSIAGDVTVVEGGKFYARGAIYGTLRVEFGGRVHIFGTIQGDVVLARGTKVIHGGSIGGDLVNNGGRLFIETIGKVAGKVKTRGGGDTQYERPPDRLDLSEETGNG